MGHPRRVWYDTSKEKYVKIKTQLVLVLYLFIYSKVTTCFGPYSGPSSGQKMNSLRKLCSVIYKIMSSMQDGINVSFRPAL